MQVQSTTSSASNLMELQHHRDSGIRLEEDHREVILAMWSVDPSAVGKLSNKVYYLRSP